MLHKSRFIAMASSVLAISALTACAPMTPTGQVTSFPTSTMPASNPQGAFVEFGRISNVEIVRAPQPSAGPGIGAVIGGVAGAVLGNQVGTGGGRTGATIIGAVGGAVAGNAIERSRTANASAGESYRVTVQLDNGTTRAYDMASYGDMRINDRVRIENGQLVRMR